MPILQNLHLISISNISLNVLGPWMKQQKDLCNKMIKIMKILGSETYGSSARGSTVSDGGTNNSGNKNTFAQSQKGVETAAARRMLARLRAFAEILPDGRMVEKDIFASVIRATGLPLTEEDILLLADATDNHPIASRIRCDVVVEALSLSLIEPVEEDVKPTKLAVKQTEAASFALSHLQSQIWTAGTRLKRTSLEWQADVSAIFKGFDNGNTGYITTEDFSLCLSLINIPVSREILRDIPMIPDGPGLVSYQKILDVILIPPSRTRDGTISSAAQAQFNLKNKKESEIAGSNAINNKAISNTVKTNTLKKKSLGTKSDSVNPLSSLLTVVRRSLHEFIVSDSSMEDAWMALLKAFRRFDPKEVNSVNPRDFCLGIMYIYTCYSFISI